MARRVLSAIDFDETDATIGTREAKRDRRVLKTYVDQRERKGNLARDMARRNTDDRPFIGWDGEGYTDDTGVHHYMLFGASTGHEIDGRSLGTAECLDLMLKVEEEYPDTYHVIFAGNYDVNMMLRDVNLSALRQLKSKGWCKWQGYTIRYIKGKMFGVKRGNVSITLYDVFTFFACSFVKALEQYIGEDNENVARIRLGKSGRADFSYADIEYVRSYFRTELYELVRLCDQLRRYLREAGITISKWHGPGAVASAVLKQRGFRRLPQPASVDIASQYAYLGGRFEQFKVGAYDGPVWQYDLRSAYPAAIATLPTLGGTWVERTCDSPISIEEVKDFALYRCSFTARDDSSHLPNPFGWRYKNGAVFYPPIHGGGWTWGCELKSAMRYADGDITVHQSLEMGESADRPFAWIAEMYERRDEWKRAGRPAQLALKLAMNSIYGKLAQQVGWRVVDGIPKLPSFHQLEYAGYITAYARAKLYAAMMQKPQNLIAVETDAVYSTVPLELDEGRALGQWEATKYDGIMYVQSGMYFAKEGDEWKYRTRGFGRNDVSVGVVREWLSGIWDSNSALTSKLGISQTRFRTMGTSLGKDDWRKWVTSPRELQAGVPGGKREHASSRCRACRKGMGSQGDTLHDMVPSFSLPNVDYREPSTKYPLEWLNEKKLAWVGENEDVWRDEY